jgi:hypothetical protein
MPSCGCARTSCPRAESYCTSCDQVPTVGGGVSVYSTFKDSADRRCQPVACSRPTGSPRRRNFGLTLTCPSVPAGFGHPPKTVEAWTIGSSHARDAQEVRLGVQGGCGPYRRGDGSMRAPWAPGSPFGVASRRSTNTSPESDSTQTEAAQCIPAHIRQIRAGTTLTGRQPLVRSRRTNRPR